ncbi:unnamed protein product, partial [Diplocarpon coronariae]
HLLFMGTKK